MNQITEIFLFISKQIFFFILAFIAIGLIYTDRSTPYQKTAQSPLAQSPLRNMQNTDDYVYLEAYNKRRADHMMFDFHTKDINFNNLGSEELNKLEQICTYKIGQEPDKIYLSKAFNCLAKIYTQKYLDKDNIFKAINNISSALEVYYLPEHAQALSASLITGFEQQLPDKFKDLSTYFTGFADDEIPILNELIKLNIPAITARVDYRLYMIHLLGRASNKEQSKPNFKLAIEELKQAIKSSNIKADNIMDIALLISDDYAQHAGVVIASALLNADLSTFYRFHIVMDPETTLSSSLIKKLEDMKNIRDYEISFLSFPEEIEKLDAANFCLSITKAPKIIMYRLFLDKLFTHLDKILYLDPDLLVLKDLTYFKQIDLKNYFMAAAMDSAIPSHERTSCFSIFKEFYINAGILYLNLGKLRKENGLNKIVQAIKNNQKNCTFDLGDQDMLNLAFEDQIYYVSSRWNDLILKRWDHNKAQEPISFIKHFTGEKPWNFKKNRSVTDNSLATLEEIYSDYWRYREVTPWKDIPVDYTNDAVKVITK